MANSRLEGGRERRSEMACKHQGVKLNVEGLPVGSIFAARFVGDKNTKKKMCI